MIHVLLSFSETKTWMAGRHCERKRSKNLINGKMDCFVAKAPRNDASLKIHTRRWKNGWSAATLEGEFSGVTNSYAGKAVARCVW